MSEANTKKDVWEMVRLGLTLVCYAVASCTVLALVNNFTSKKILLNQLDKANAAMKEVFAQADEFKPVSDFEPSSNNSIIELLLLCKLYSSIFFANCFVIA